MTRKIKALEVLSAAALFLASVWSAHVLDVGPGPLDGYGRLGEFFSTFYERATYNYLMLMLLSAAFFSWASYVKYSRTRQAMYKLLDAIVAEVMNTPQTFNSQDFRVTLFVHKRFSLRGFLSQAPSRNLIRCRSIHCIGWLVPYARSGDDRRGGSCFRAPLVANQGQASGHGVCGTAWILGECYVDGLPALARASGDAQRRKYATKAHMTFEEVCSRLSAGRSLARSYCAERISTSQAPRWGVLVYDSVDPAPVIDEGNKKAHSLSLQAVSLLLEEYQR